MHLARLAPSLDDVAPGFERALVGQSREAPAIFKHAGIYFLFTSGCTGWEPNRAEVFYSRCGRCPWQFSAVVCSKHAGLALSSPAAPALTSPCLRLGFQVQLLLQASCAHQKCQGCEAR